MGLVISRGAGEGFSVGGRHFRVVELSEPSGCVLRCDAGRAYSLSPDVPIQLTELVSALEGPRRLKGVARLVLTAPKEVPIWRDEARTLALPASSGQLEIALLAPVPVEHLQSGLETVASQGKVAFGSRAWEVFRSLDVERNGIPVEALFYASYDQSPAAPVASWRGTYVGHVASRGGRHPAGMRFRPQSTAKYAEDNLGHWAIFWEVTDLRRVEPAEAIPIGDLFGFRSQARFKPYFRPEGPLLVENPFPE